MASLPYRPGLSFELALRLGVVNVTKGCIHRLGDGLRHEEVWHPAEQLSYGSPAVLHAESCVGVHPLHELIPDC